MNREMLDRMQNGKGFIAALDQSGGSTPKALRLYGVDEGAYKDEAEMFDMVHAMRTRIIKSKSFTNEKILGAILFEMTMDRTIDGIPTAQYLWEKKGIVPFLKVDKGLDTLSGGVQLMKPIDTLDDILVRAKERRIFGTKMRSVIKEAQQEGIRAVVDQQFEYGLRITQAGLVPIIEPEVDIHSADKAKSEEILKAEIAYHLDRLPQGVSVMLKLSIPSVSDLYSDIIAHPGVMRVVALSGGYSRNEANRLLAENPGLIASFSRALSEGLCVSQSDQEFNETLARSIDGIYRASMA